MLRFLLDTSICIYLMKEQPESVIRRFSACKPGEVGVSSITWAELCCGLDVHNSQPELAALSNSLCWRRGRFEPCAGFAVSQSERAEIQT